jgi:RNA polymerase sigma factor (sigma-70 family)
MDPRITEILERDPKQWTTPELGRVRAWLARPTSQWTAADSHALDKWKELIAAHPAQERGAQGVAAMTACLLGPDASRWFRVCYGRVGGVHRHAFAAALDRGLEPDAAGEVYRQFGAQIWEVSEDAFHDKVIDLHQKQYRAYDPATPAKRCRQPQRPKVETWLWKAFFREAGRKAKSLLGKLIKDRLTARATAQQRDQEKAVSDDQQLERLPQYLDQLPATQREAIELCIEQGLSHSQAAATAGCQEGAMRVRLHRARQTPRQLAARAQNPIPAAIGGPA